MKKSFCFFLLFIAAIQMHAKKVKFSVDLTGQTISPNGVHVMGDFQDLAGLGPDWDPGTALMSKEGTTMIYSIIVNIPAFRKYEYRFLNGDQSYEAEFVPDKSRVGYDNLDNRWVFIDSVANDTTKLAPIVFAGNAPAGKYLIRYKVDMNLLGSSLAPQIYVGTSYHQTPVAPMVSRLYSYGSTYDEAKGIYEVMEYAVAGTHSYLYFNGKLQSSAETPPAACTLSGKRQLSLVSDTILNLVCFDECEACKGVGMAENSPKTVFSANPNPASVTIQVNTAEQPNLQYQLLDQTGKQVLSGKLPENSTIDISEVPVGFYLLEISNNQQKGFQKLIVTR